MCARQIVDTPGFGEAINNEKTFRSLCNLIDSRFAEYESNERRRERWDAATSGGIEKRDSEDGRIHCCLYFIRPGSDGLRLLDVQVLPLQFELNHFFGA